MLSKVRAKIKALWHKIVKAITSIKAKVITKQMALTVYAWLISKFTHGRTNYLLIKEFINVNNTIQYE